LGSTGGREEEEEEEAGPEEEEGSSMAARPSTTAFSTTLRLFRPAPLSAETTAALTDARSLETRRTLTSA